MEHATLLYHALKQLGFDAVIMGGEVFHGTWTAPNSHASVLVTFADGPRYLCDAGYPLRSAEPLLLSPGQPQQQADGRAFRIERYTASFPSTSPSPPADAPADADWVLHMRIRGEWAPQHRFREAPMGPPDFEAAARGLLDPASSFRRGWLLSICREDGALVTLATGSWAGADVPPTHAKYVVRRRVAHDPHGQQGGLEAAGPGHERAAGGSGGSEVVAVARADGEVAAAAAGGAREGQGHGHGQGGEAADPVAHTESLLPLSCPSLVERVREEFHGPGCVGAFPLHAPLPPPGQPEASPPAQPEPQ